MHDASSSCDILIGLLGRGEGWLEENNLIKKGSIHKFIVMTIEKEVVYNADDECSLLAAFAVTMILRTSRLLCAKDGEERRKGLIKGYMKTAIELHEIAYRLHCAMTESELVPYDALHDGSLQKVKLYRNRT